MRKKEKQIILKIILDEEGNNIAGWETSLKGFDKRIIITDVEFVNKITSMLNHHLGQIHIEKTNKDNEKSKK